MKLEQQARAPRTWFVPRALVTTLIVMLAVVAVLLAIDLAQLLRSPTVAPLTIHVLGDCR